MQNEEKFNQYNKVKGRGRERKNEISMHVGWTNKKIRTNFGEAYHSIMDSQNESKLIF